MRVELFGSPPEHVHERLRESGLRIESSPGAAGIVWPDKDGLDALRALAERGDPGLALVESDEHILAAAIAGAAGMVDISSPSRMRLEIECHLRYRRKAQEHRRAVEQRMEELSGRLFTAMSIQQRLIATCPSPVICADPSGRVTVFNTAAEEALGYDADYACSHMHITDIYANPADYRRVLAEVRCTDDRISHELSVRLRARSGEQIPMYVSAAEVLDTEGEAMAVVSVFEDRRIEKGLRDRLGRATDQLIRAEQRAEAVVDIRETAHELNQPLTALMGAIELMTMQEEVPESIDRRLKHMHKQMDRMAKIVRGLGEKSEHLDSYPPEP
ncbi:MAG: PAS domain-containing protein [Myxococcota bacterium]